MGAGAVRLGTGSSQFSRPRHLCSYALQHLNAGHSGSGRAAAAAAALVGSSGASRSWEIALAASQWEAAQDGFFVPADAGALLR